MSDIKLFSIGNSEVKELASQTAKLEKTLQYLVESQMEVFLGVRFLATEYGTGKTHKGRIDSLGLDENGCPVIIEYKRSSNENVINQGLFYLDWLLDHRAEFQLLVMKAFGEEVADNIEWGGSRLICIAADFNKYDEHAVQQIDRNIELMRYRYFGEALLLLELVNAQTSLASGKVQTPVASENTGNKKTYQDKVHANRMAEASENLKSLFHELSDYIVQLGDEVQKKELKLYVAFKKIKNFASVIVNPGKKDEKLLLFLKLPGELGEENEFSRDVSTIGHWGTGDLEITIRTTEDIERAKPLIEQSYIVN